MMVMASMYKDRPRWAWWSKDFTQSQESLLPQDQPAIPMSRLIDRLRNKPFLPVITITNIAIAVIAAALLLWNWVCLVPQQP